MTQTQQLSPQIFTVWNDEIKGRIDPSFYCPEFEKVELRYFQAQTLQNQAEEVLKKAKEKAEAMILG